MGCARPMTELRHSAAAFVNLPTLAIMGAAFVNLFIPAILGAVFVNLLVLAVMEAESVNQPIQVIMGVEFVNLIDLHACEDLLACLQGQRVRRIEIRGGQYENPGGGQASYIYI